MSAPFPNTIDRNRVFQNVKFYEAEGESRAQAIAHAFNDARKTHFKRFPDGLLPEWLCYKKGMRHATQYLPSGAPIKDNPIYSMPRAVPKVTKAARLYTAFTGHEVDRTVKVPFKGAGFDTGFIVGSVLGVELELPSGDLRVLQFDAPPRAQDLPALAVSFDGLKAVFIGGDYSPLSSFLDKPEILAIMYQTVRDGVSEKYRHPFAPHARPHLQVLDGRNAKMSGGSFRFTDRGFIDTRLLRTT